jgi:hypothetical protein
MPFSGMLRHVVVVRTDFSEEHITSIIKVTRIGQLGTSAVISNRSMLLHYAVYIVFLHSMLRLLDVHSWPILVTLMSEAIHSCEMSVLT